MLINCVAYENGEKVADIPLQQIRAHLKGPASFVCDYEITRDGLLLVAGWTRLAVCERDSGGAVPMPPWLRELFERAPAEAVAT